MSVADSARRDRSLLVIFVVAAALRAAYVLDVFDSDSVRYLMVDSRAYHERALAILAGDWLGDRVFYQDPLYPYLLAGLYAVFGAGSAGVLLAQGALDAVSVVLVHAAARNLFGPRCGWVAGLAAAFYGPFLYYDALVLKTTLSLFLTALVSFLLSLEGVGRGRWLGAGLALGAACLTRGNFLLVAPVLLAWIALRFPAPRRARLAAAGLVALGLVLAIAPVTLRNRVVGGEWVLVTSQAGQNFFIGNARANSTGIYEAPAFVRANPAHEEADFAREARRRTGRELTPAETSRFWLGQGLREIAADPGHFVSHGLRKLRMFANDYEVPDNTSYDFFRERVSRLLHLPLPSFGLVLPLALAGAWLARRDRRASFLLWFALSYTGSVLLFYNMSRYRIPVLAALIPLASRAAVHLFDLALARRGRALLPWLVFLALAVVLAHQEVGRVDFGKQHYNLGLRHAEEARELLAGGERGEAERHLDRAAAELRRAREMRPEHLAIGQAWEGVLAERLRLAEEQGEPERAAALAQELVEASPESADAWWQLGRNLARSGERDRAERALLRALLLAPEHAGAREELAALRAHR